MNYLLQLRDFLSGRKTYITMLAAVLTALAGWSEGGITDAELIRVLFEAGGLSTLRAGIAAAQNKGA